MGRTAASSPGLDPSDGSTRSRERRRSAHESRFPSSQTFWRYQVTRMRDGRYYQTCSSDIDESDPRASQGGCVRRSGAYPRALAFSSRHGSVGLAHPEPAVRDHTPWRTPTLAYDPAQIPQENRVAFVREADFPELLWGACPDPVGEGCRRNNVSGDFCLRHPEWHRFEPD